MLRNALPGNGIKAAKFPAVKSLDSFDFKAIPKLNKMQVLELARCEWIERRENVIALGPSGTGKTHVALGLGLAACQKGLSVTKHALLERCGLSAIFEMADKLDMALLSCGGISSLTTSYRTGYLSEADRRSLVEAGAIGDVLYNFIDANGDLVDHEVNSRVISVNLARLRRTPERVLISGGKDKLVALRATIKTIAPTTLITDEQTALALISE